MYISNPFNFQPSVEIKPFCTCHIHFRSGKACLWSRGTPHVCARGRRRGLGAWNGFSMWVIVAVRRAARSSYAFSVYQSPASVQRRSCRVRRPVAHPISAWEAPSPPQQALNLQKEKKKEWGGGGEEKDVDTCSEEAKEFCLLLGAISAFCCGKDLPFTALLKHLQSLQI